ncbi:hypothetical protein [Polluticoccus soli]|uniref:hypothetical protein n=1 Tax=Polluticoccus soli TaxID=3034150 RepID=UPI0023E206FA|nr:hypothetical protein [Flavipsychrobacter sp. JY13-12]
MIKKIAPYLVVAIFPIGFYILDRNDCEDWIRKNVPLQSYTGIVTSKFIDSNDRDIPKVVLDEKSVHSVNNIDAFHALTVGDLLIKTPGTLRHIIVRSGRDTVIYYQECNGKEVKD